METWFLIIATACLAALIRAFLSLKPKPKLPPGPRGLGPIITLPISSRPAIFISTHELAHQALVHNGACFADRPSPTATAKVASSNQHTISSAGYGPTWHTLRRNLTSQILHPSRVKEYSHARKWVLGVLITRLSSVGDSPVKVMDCLQFAMFCLLVLMCYEDRLEESKIREILNFWPRLPRVLLWKRWELFFALRKRQQEVLSPLIRVRKDVAKNDVNKSVTSYVDTLLNLEVLDDEECGSKRKLTEEELISACSEFLTAGTDTTSTALQWIMANLVKYPDIQAQESLEEKQRKLQRRTWLRCLILRRSCWKD
ncbi:hypothetical protein Cgig2_033186 [Carnegiea gigantea]|uniref:Cytochrome P450 n=1 Tax=Carnegiea gigantea TaxID=171969 RepID=A0A9Q1JUL5_9CARY|nr:hypothetical protein Cgig2_033186 [Carnegiea gigantea]